MTSKSITDYKKYLWPAGVASTWLISWVSAIALAPLLHPLITGSAAGAMLSTTSQKKWRKAMIAMGFPFSYAILDLQGDVMAWIWLAPVIALLAIYPPRLWTDAPMFPTPKRSIAGLSKRLKLEDGAKILDAGCGMGHAIAALHEEFPKARLFGSEQSWLTSRMAKHSHKYAAIEQCDMWQQDWGQFDMIYVFHRPDTMSRAMQKACEQLHSGAWMASLEFKDDDYIPDLVWHNKGEKPIYLYRMPIKNREKYKNHK